MKVVVIPIVIDALEVVPKDHEKRLGKLEIRGRIETIQIQSLRPLTLCQCYAISLSIYIYIYIMSIYQTDDYTLLPIKEKTSQKNLNLHKTELNYTHAHSHSGRKIRSQLNTNYHIFFGKKKLTSIKTLTPRTHVHARTHTITLGGRLVVS